MAQMSVFLIIVLAFGAWADSSDVLVLNTANFDSTLKSNDYTFVEFYAPWCGHCKKLAPEWEGVATELKGQVAVGKVDATVEVFISERYGVQGFPALLLFRKGTHVKYNGPRDKNTMIRWVKELSTKLPITEVKSVDDLEEFQDSSEVVVLGLFGSSNKNEEDQFKAIAFEQNPRNNPTYSPDFPFGSANGDEANELAKHLNVKIPAVVMFRQFEFEDTKVVFDGEWSALSKWVTSNALPTLIVASEKTQNEFLSNIQTGNGLLVIFTSSTDKETKTAANKLALAYKSNSNLKVVLGLDDNYGPHLADQFFGTSKDNYPFAGLLEFGQTEAEDKTFTLKGEKLTVERLEKFIQDWKESKLFVPVDPTTVVTSSNFEDIVLKSSKHVLLEFYAPWCGHCQRLVPTYKKLAARFENDNDVVIAKMDATANSHSSLSIRSYPTILWYPKNDKSNPIKYEGGRDLESFVSFVEKSKNS